MQYNKIQLEPDMNNNSIESYDFVLDIIIFQLVPTLPELFIYLRTLIKLSLLLRSSILWVEIPHSFNLFLPLGFADF